MARVSFEVPDGIAERFRQLAAARGVPEDDLVVAAMALFAEQQAELEERVAAGRADIAAGRFVEHDAVAAWLRSWGTGDEQPPPPCD